MSARLEFCLLGPPAVRRDGVTVGLPEGKQRALLAALLLKAGEVVPTSDLTDWLWAPAPPPPSAQVTVRNYVKRLRQALGPARERLVTRPGGYLLRVESAELDIRTLERRLAEACRAAADAAWSDVARHAAAALELWRGEPLSGIDLPVQALAEVSRWQELRLQAHELRIEADLHLGMHAAVIAELRELERAYPLREHLAALLMLALYRCGRRGESLRIYRACRKLLVQEMGAEPGPELQDLHQRILRDDPALASASPGPRTESVPGPGATGIWQLPPAVPSFTGREAELATLTRYAMPEAAAPALVISAIGGTAGVGKTALAVKWAHQVMERFPDGQLYVNLRGYDPQAPVSPADALAGFLRALGVPGQQIPDGTGERSVLFRSRLAGRRMLVMLDNARDGEQVRPLLPGDPGCVAVVTSRDGLAGLVATDGALRVDLDVLPHADALALLRSLIGDRVDEDPASASELAELCARLPLALRIAAELATARRNTSLRELAAELAAARLDCLDAGDDRADIRAVFSWSLRQLPEDVASAFALIGLHPGADLDTYGAAALTATTPGKAQEVLERLDRASLLQHDGAGRYGTHDLLRAYGHEQAAVRYGEGSCRQKLTRLFDYYAAATAAAIEVMFPAESPRQPGNRSTSSRLPPMPGAEDARGWLDRERANLVATVVHCASNGWPRHATDLAARLFPYLIAGSHLPEAQTIYAHALEAARDSGDPAAEAEALNGLGGIVLRKGHFRDAVGHYQNALKRYRQCGDRVGEGRVLYNLGLIERQLNEHQTSADHFRQSVAAFEEAGNSLGAARALADLAAAETELHSYDQAAEHLQLALPVLRSANDHLYEAGALERIGELNLHRAQLTQAAEHFEQALTIFRRMDHQAGVAAVLLDLGGVSLREGDCQQGITRLEQALTLHQKIGYQHGEIKTLRALAEALAGAGKPAAAHDALQKAIQLAAETGNTVQQASAHHELAGLYQRTGHDERARHHLQQALDLYEQSGAPEAEQIRSRLT
jgi:DNA-binding SARP family transcriptional activator/tetratricopeptide (TPR) repeat protein